MNYKNLLFLPLIFGTTLSAFAAVNEVKTQDVVAPVMINRTYNPFVGINVVADNTDNTLNEISVKLNSSKGIKKIVIHQAPGADKINFDQNLADNTIVGNVENPKGKTISIPLNLKLKSGNNLFIVNIIPDKTAEVGEKITATVSFKANNKTLKQKVKASQRIGYAVTTPHQKIKVHEAETGKVLREEICKFFRIPGIAKTKKGTLIAVFDNRYNHNGDLPAKIDVAISRSTDQGQTWSPIYTVINRDDIPGIGNGVGDPAILVDEENDRIWVAGLAAPKTGHPIWKSHDDVDTPDKCGQFVLAYSDDDGLTWSKPINITRDIKRVNDPSTKGWGCLFQGPGNGICMQDGTLVFPAQVWGKRHMGVLVYSKDNGKTWQSSNAMEFGGSESQVAELSNGSLMLNTREGAGNKRQVGVTNDLGKTWQKHPSVNTEAGKLVQPNGLCQGCLIAVRKVAKKPHVLFFSNPATHAGRSMMTLKYSLDDGNTWSKGLLYDQRNGMGYSAIIPVDKKHVGVFYEGAHHYLYFIKIPYSEIFPKSR